LGFAWCSINSTTAAANVLPAPSLTATRRWCLAALSRRSGVPAVGKRGPDPDQSDGRKRVGSVSAVDCVFAGAMSSPPSVEETRMKLDYEAQCYRQEGMILRARLQRLQDAAEKMIRAVRQRNLMMSSR
jgi:hypothetical protein